MDNPKYIKPNLFVVGAPRSGTTSLHYILSQHPEVYMSKVKEPHYFSTIPIPKTERLIHRVAENKKDYLKLFKDAKGEKYIGEASAHYLSDPGAPQRIHKFSPDAKIIAILRNPVERAYSHFSLQERRGGSDETFLHTIQQNIKYIGDTDKLFTNYVEIGFYCQQLQRYFNVFPRENILVLRFDDLKKDKKTLLDQISDFLGIEPWHIIEDQPEKNVYQESRNTTVAKILRRPELIKYGLKLIPRPILRYTRNNILLKKADKKPMDPKSRKLLEEIYVEDSQNLEKLLKKFAREEK